MCLTVVGCKETDDSVVLKNIKDDMMQDMNKYYEFIELEYANSRQYMYRFISKEGVLLCTL